MEVSVELEWTTCVDCGTPFAMTKSMMDDRREKHGAFWCPNGHSLIFPAKSEADKLRDKLAAAERQLAEANRQLSEVDLERARRRKQLAAAREKKRKLRAVS